MATTIYCMHIQYIDIECAQAGGGNHHRQLHRGSYSISVERGPQEPQLLFTTPAGSRIESSFFPLFQKVSAETSREALRAMAPNVDSHTCVSKWRGEDCDYGMAIDALLERDNVPGG